MISLDTETSGLDHFHGAKPFFVTTCSEGGEQRFWEWPVDPLTREPQIPKEDLKDVRDLLLGVDRVVLHNAKFDCHALTTVLPELVDAWPWDRTEDTLIAGHLLASNEPHNLTDMALNWLNDEHGSPIDIEPFEKHLQECTLECRRQVQQARLRVNRGTADEADEPFCRWAIAEEGRPDMPSAKEKTWKFDAWLPRAMAKHSWKSSAAFSAFEKNRIKGRWRTTRLGINAAEKLPGWGFRPPGTTGEDDPGHPWWTVTRDYANADSATTIQLWITLREELERRGLMGLYREKMRNLPALADMERCGATINRKELESLRDEYVRESAEREQACVIIAKGFKGDDGNPYELVLPKSGNNGSLHVFAFEHLKLPVVKLTDKGRPSMDKDTFEAWSTTLPDGVQRDFISHIRGKRKRDTALGFLDAYERFWKRLREGRTDWFVLHPSFNPTGTATTRLSCRSPNLQQASKQETLCGECGGDGCDSCEWSGEDLHNVRRIFGPGPGREWWSADAKNIELRIPFYVCGEEELIALFEKPDEPPFYGSNHLLNFSVVYADVWEKELGTVCNACCKGQRVTLDRIGPHCKKRFASSYYQWVKNGDFACQYQAGDATADKAFHRKGARRMLQARFSRLDALNRRCVDMAKRCGYVETLPDKSLGGRGYPLFCPRAERGEVLPTTPLNFFSQGTAGWWMVKAINRCHARIREWRQQGFDARMILTVHDELVFDLPCSRFVIGGKPENLKRMNELRRLMEQGGEDIDIPTPCSLEWHPVNWAKGISL